MSWAFKRQILYLFLLLVFLAGIGFWASYSYLNKPATCTDGKQNGTETGVDCGGICVRACFEDTDPLAVIWARTFQVVPGRYNAVAYLENHNQNSAIQHIKYKFTFTDENNLYIGKRDGEAYIPPTGKFAIFEPAIGLGYAVPVHTTFQFTEVPVWLKVPKDKLSQLELSVSNISLEDEDTSPKLFASIRNNSFFSIPNVNVVAIVYDGSGVAISASRTYLEKLAGEETAEVSFTWPEPFGKKVISKEIIPIFDIFAVKLK